MAHVDRVHVLLRLEVVEGELVADGGGRLVLVLPRVLVVRGGVLVRARVRVRVRARARVRARDSGSPNP